MKKVIDVEINFNRMKKLLFVLLLAATPTFVFADATSTATITIRDGNSTAFTGIIELAASTTPPTDIAPTNSTSTVPVPADSLLATLIALDATTTDFEITDLAYFSLFDSFLINCIAISSASTTDCFNWTYAVNGTFPQVGVDHQTLHNGDVVYLFFGPPRQTVLSTTTVIIGEPFTATAQTYDLQSGNYVGASNLTIGVGTPNPDFSFTELATSTSDANGEAIFALNATGTFAVGIQEDFYFPATSITIIDVPATTTEAISDPVPPISTSGGGGGGGSSISHAQLNVSNALAYLASKQNADGSFYSPFLSDWVALAFAAADPDATKGKLHAYMLTRTPTLSSVTDYERHAMVLQALGINPYSGTPTDYISPIVASFDGIQIGDLHLDNDDIFALFPLLHAGYTTDENIIQKTVAFILSAQNADGSWDASADMTAAAVQGLSQVATLPNVSMALSRAETYLRSQQQSNGGFGNSFSTSWALQAVQALGGTPFSWAPGGYFGDDYLAGLQQSDGGIEPVSSGAETRVWATAYAIPAALGKTWTALLQQFAKPSTNTVGSAVIMSAESLNATSTSERIATGTLPVATSTLAVLPEILKSPTLVVAVSQVAKLKQKVPLQRQAIVRAETLRELPLPTTAANQTAALASAPSANLFTRLGHLLSSIVAFLSKFL